MGYMKDLATAVKDNPSDAASYVVVAVLTALLLLDFFNAISLSVELLSKGAVFTLIFLLAVATSSRRSAVAQRNALDQVTSGLRDLKREVEIRVAAAQVVEVSQYEIKGRLDDLLRSAQWWHFRGGLGGWQRSTVLPVLGEVTRHDVRYVMQILNPADEALCRRYAEYRARSRHRPGTDDPEKVRDELLAMLYAVAWYGYRTRITPHVSFLPLFSPLRYDMGDDGLVGTVPDPEARALYSPADGWYYTAVRDELEQASKALPRVTLPSDERNFPADWRSVTEVHVRHALGSMTVAESGEVAQPLLQGWADPQRLDFSEISQLSFAGRIN